MKHDTCLARLTEVQVVPHHDIEKVVRSECAVRWRLDERNFGPRNNTNDTKEPPAAAGSKDSSHSRTAIFPFSNFASFRVFSGRLSNPLFETAD
ncbi:MAG: hypothetical protein DME98_04580 [Verrucomicrobia bacterium]|nr:MAG: hypothetical protein DME98_04580 [Verrucomicrobiota bacterium]PYJ34547.1 MAG: hypothetical protein DME88_04800 [Verrucomicrobiota bacterium]